MRSALLAGIAAVALSAVQAQAAMITSNASFDLTGSLRAITESTFDQANGIDFAVNNNGTLTFGTAGGTVTMGGAINAVYTAAGFNVGSVGTVVDIASGNLTVGTKNIAGFYSFTNGTNTLSFDLGSITQISRTPENAAASVAPTINLYGTGTLNLTGYDPTPGTFALSTANTGTGMTATFQSSVISATNVPEPASLALLGLGAASVVAAARRRKVA